MVQLHLALMLLSYYYAVVSTENPTTKASSLPSSLLANQGFFLNDTLESHTFHFAESFYLMETVFDRSFFWENWNQGILPLMYPEWNPVVENAYQSSYGHVLKSCQREYLPSNVLEWNELKEKLIKEIVPSLDEKDLDLTFPIIEGDDLSNYYHHRLTTCTVNSNGIDITFKIPVKRKGSKFQLKQVRRVRFLVPPYTCHLGEDPEAKYIILRNNEKFLVTSAMEFDCDPELHGRGAIKDLCLVPTTAKSNLSPCLEAIISNAPIEEVHKNCRKYDCEKPRFEDINVAGNSFFATNFKSCVKLNCTEAGMKEECKCVETPTIGALEVSLCRCSYNMGLGLLRNYEACPPADLLDYNSSLRKVFPSSMIIQGVNVTLSFLHQEELENSI